MIPIARDAPAPAATGDEDSLAREFHIHWAFPFGPDIVVTWGPMHTPSEDETMIKCSCACGRVRFEIESARSMTYCHCVNCRKLTAASVATYVHVEKDKFHWLSGEDNINTYESSPGAFRKF